MRFFNYDTVSKTEIQFLTFLPIVSLPSEAFGHGYQRHVV